MAVKALVRMGRASELDGLFDGKLKEHVRQHVTRAKAQASAREACI